MNVVYKKRQEEILINELASSGMISREQLLEIKGNYDEGVPFHNFLHALTIASKVLELPQNKFNIIEVRSLFLAALFHDAGHSGTAQDLDEFRSLDIAFENIEKFEKKYNYEGVDFPIVRKAIIGTVFKNRGKSKDKYSRILADLDIHFIGEEFHEFLYYSDFGMALEIGSESNNEFDIREWFDNISYFKFLMGINNKIFMSDTVRNELLNPALTNIERYVNIKKNNYRLSDNTSIIEVFEYWKDNDITLSEFREKFFA